MTASRFAATAVGLTGYPPPGDPATGMICWLCGGDTCGAGWPLRAWLKPTFTNHNLAACPSSDAVCWCCAAMTAKETWDRYVTAHPERGLKTGQPISWRFYSHLFTTHSHECPTREQCREWLLRPPDPPFVFVITTSGQKHLIFRAKIAQNRDVFPIQFEEHQIMVNRSTFTDVLAVFEALYALGFSKDSILTGAYNHAQLISVDKDEWRTLETKVSGYRQRHGLYLQLAHHCARRIERAVEPPPRSRSVPVQQPAQMDLFA